MIGNAQDVLIVCQIRKNIDAHNNLGLGSEFVDEGCPVILLYKCPARKKNMVALRVYTSCVVSMCL